MVREDAARDAAYAEQLCEQLGIPFFLKEVDMGSYAKEQKLSSEEALGVFVGFEEYFLQ